MKLSHKDILDDIETSKQLNDPEKLIKIINDFLDNYLSEKQEQ